VPENRREDADPAAAGQGPEAKPPAAAGDEAERLPPPPAQEKPTPPPPNRAGREAPSEDEPDPSSAPVGDLLDRLQEQTETIAELTRRLERAERSLKTERTGRKRLSSELEELRAEKARSEEQLGRLRSERDHLLVSEDELVRVQESAGSVSFELDQAWVQIHDLRRQLALSQRPWWRKLFGLRPRG
jgi:hypothetical protein